MAVTPEAINLPDRFFPQLLSFLESLRVAGYSIGTGEFIKVRTVFQLMMRRGILPADLRQLKIYIGTIVCSSAAEQRDFETRFNDWIGRFGSPSATEEKAAAATIAPKAPTMDRFLQQLRRQNRIILVVALLASLCLGVYYFAGMAGSLFTTGPPVTTSEPAPQPKVDAALDAPTAKPPMKIWALAIALAPILLWLIVRACRLHRFLSRQKIRGPIEIRQLFVEKPKVRRFFASGLIRQLRSLRAHVEVESDDIDPSATVTASARMGGFYTPMMGVRKLSPEYLLLIDRKTRHDHQARLFDAVTECLMEADIYFHRYYFDADPRSCLTGEGGPATPVSLKKLAARYQYHRLILFTDGAGLINPFTDQTWHWCSQFHLWDQRIILTPTSREGWGPWEDALGQNGFQLLPVDDQGLRQLASAFRPDKAMIDDRHVPTEPLPELFVTDSARWYDSMPPDPEVLHEMLTALRWYLRPEGYLWLCACAVYPQLDWSLTLFLGHNLTRAAGSHPFNRTTLAALSQLPWFRRGTMPDWLREILIGDLPKDTETKVRQLLHNLLISSLENPLESFELAYAMKKRDRTTPYAKKIWRAMRRHSDRLSPVHDHLFVTFMENPLAVRIPGALHHVFAAPGHYLDSLHRLRQRLTERTSRSQREVRPKTRPQVPAAERSIWKQAAGFGIGLIAIFVVSSMGDAGINGTTWVYLLLGLYIVYCVYQGERLARRNKTSVDFMLGQGATPVVAMALAGTAFCFSGWSTIGHPGLVWRDGLPYGFAAFMTVTIALTGTFFGKRLWLLSKRYGFVTPSEMHVHYYQNPAIRWLVNLTSLLYAVFYAAVQLMAAAAIFNVIAGVPVTFGAIFLAGLLWIYMCRGGYPAVLQIGSVQMLFTYGAIFVLGYYTISHIGAWQEFMGAAHQLSARFMEVPRVVNIGLGGASSETAWTAMMILTYMFALMSIQASPAFTMYFFSMKSPSSLTWQQLFCSTLLMGVAMFFFTNFQGLGAKIMELRGSEAVTSLSNATVVPSLMRTLLPPLALGLVFIGHIAACQSTAAAHIVSGNAMLVRDFYWRSLRRQEAGDREQIWITRLAITATLILCLTVGFTSKAALVIFGALATSFGLLMYIPLLGVVWGFRLSGRGVVLGILSGMVATYLTYKVWRYPLSMHCAFWGLSVGLIVAWLARDSGRTKGFLTVQQMEIRQWLDAVDPPSESARRWRASLKWIIPLWFFFAVGPGCILGNRAFSILGLPPLWSWQVVWWLAGILMMYAFCIKAEMTTWSGNPEDIVAVDPDRIAETYVEEA